MECEDIERFDSLEEQDETTSTEQVADNVESHMQENEDDEMTSDQALRALENAWLNEKFAPELLPHEGDLIQCMLQQISHMEDNLKKTDKGDIRINIHTMEISRIRYIISSYLRKRLEKIEEYTIYLLQEDAKRAPEEAFMTQAEARFARDYLTSIENLFTALALQHMPVRMNSFDLNKMSSTPNMKKHVFVRANKIIKGVIIPGSLDEEVDFEEGSQHIIQYSAVADLVKSGDVQLI